MRHHSTILVICGSLRGKIVKNNWLTGEMIGGVVTRQLCSFFPFLWVALKVRLLGCGSAGVSILGNPVAWGNACLPN